MTQLIILFHDQLSLSLSSLAQVDKQQAHIIMIECLEIATHVKHHKKKLVFIFSAMRHFAATLRSQGYTVWYSQLDDPANTGGLTSEIARVLASVPACRSMTLTHPSDYWLLEQVQTWEGTFNLPVHCLPDTRFLWSTTAFNAWAAGRKQCRLEYFYRETRKRYGILMAGNDPVGGQWNYDAANRRPLPASQAVPDPTSIAPDAITESVIAMVKARFPDHFGDILPFYFAVTRVDALRVFQAFITDRLPYFGDYQDAMRDSNPFLFHSHCALYLNNGLLLPLECVQAAETAYKTGQAPLNAVEGFIRQIIGWREYIRGIYWLKMPGYADLNYLNATRELPAFYWTGKTKLACLRGCIQDTRQYAYANHIQRLMVLCNFALVAGIRPAAINLWFWVVYADAYQWVELPNVSGMSLFADGGYLGSKPYAASGQYIRRMANYCDTCVYTVREKTGPRACPFNYLYWDFISRNRDKLAKNPRMSMAYRTYDRLSVEKRTAIAQSSTAFLGELF